MLSSCFYLPAILIAIHISLVQTAPLDAGLMHIDRINLPATNPDFDYVLINKAKLQQLSIQLEEAEFNMMLMQLLQLNMMKIMLVLDAVIIACLFYHAKQNN